MKVKVDPDLCTGCGLCEESCPEVFEVVDNLARVKATPVPPAAEKTCRQAADDCPTEAIGVEA
jgi:ferredoxin